MKVIHTDRSRIESFQRCPRLRWLEYHQDGTGITGVRKPLPLCVGGAVHVGLAALLDCSMGIPLDELSFQLAELKAVQAALADFAQFAQRLQVDNTEGQVVPEAQSQFDQYLYAEQSALVEGLVRAYARRRLQPLLEQFEVLEVEREGEWLLHKSDEFNETFATGDYELWFMSRPDALLLERSSRQLYLLSYKTAAAWDIRKARDAEHDMQGLSEGIEIERRLAEWWEHGQQFPEGKFISPNERTMEYLKKLDAPPRILAVRYEYLLKGERWRDKDLSARLGMDARSQRSPLVRGYMNAVGDGFDPLRGGWNVSWDYLKPDGTGETSKLNYRAWKSEPVWEHMTIAQWIDKLADSAECTSGDTGQLLGVKSAAQATGYLARDPLDEIFIPPVVVYRNEDDLRDLVEQMESQERRVAESVAQVEAAGTDEGERRSRLNQLFPQTRRACEYPITCAMAKVCYGGEDIRRDPLGSGLYTIRVPNHPVEARR